MSGDYLNKALEEWDEVGGSGVQYHYFCRVWSGRKADSGVTRFNEIELEAWDALKWVSEWDDLIKEQVAEYEKYKKLACEVAELDHRAAAKRAEAK